MSKAYQYGENSTAGHKFKCDECGVAIPKGSSYTRVRTNVSRVLLKFCFSCEFV